MLTPPATNVNHYTTRVVSQFEIPPLSFHAKHFLAARCEVAAIHTSHGSCDFAQDDKRWMQRCSEAPELKKRSPFGLR